MKLFLVFAVFAVVATATYADKKHVNHRGARSKGISKQMNDAAYSPNANEGQNGLIGLVIGTVRNMLYGYLRSFLSIAKNVPVIGSIAEWLEQQVLYRGSDYDALLSGLPIGDDFINGIFNDEKSDESTTAASVTEGTQESTVEPSTEYAPVPESV